jgi:PAS domain S-box-containing protein
MKTRASTAERHAEKVLESSERRYRRLFETAKDGILILDATTGEITDVNPFLSALLGYSFDELHGKRIWEISPFRDIAANREAFQQLRKKAYIRYEHLPLERKDGKRADVEFISNAYDEDGTRVIQCNVRDISARKQLEQQRADFVATLTHDIRSPLGVVASYTELALETSGVPAEVREFLAAIERSVQTLLSLVANYLQHSQIDADGVRLMKQPLDVNALLERVCRPWQAECARRHLTLELRLLFPDLGLMNGDPAALERVFTNLVHNALKFTPDGGRITVESKQDGANVVVVITDTGPGIAAKEVPNLFVRYRRMSGRRSHEGAGLGLFIVKALVEGHGGSVRVVSRRGTGSSFVVVLPITPQPQQGGPDPSRGNCKTRH